MSKILKNGLFILYAITFTMFAYSDDSSLTEGSTDEDNHYLLAGCSDWKPYCYKEGEHLEGSFFDATKLILDAAQMKYSFNVYPWARVYNLGLKQEDFLVLGLGRTPKRELLFKWIGPLKKAAKIYAFQRETSEVVLTTADDLLGHVIAVERGSYTYDYLIDRGHDKEKIITVPRPDQLFNIILHERAQLFLLGDHVFQSEVVREGLDPSLFKRSMMVFTVSEYLAASNKTSDEVVKKLQTSYQKLLRKGKINLLE
jgi:polar amino acid transport system substrate-binding protein